MSQEMMDKTCRGFAEALAAREPVPGGGSASAFVGALGASLCGMVARYGATNPALADRADDLTRAFAQADELAQELVELVAEDVRAYGQVSAAYGIPRDDPARATAIQDALHNVINSCYLYHGNRSYRTQKKSYDDKRQGEDVPAAAAHQCGSQGRSLDNECL